MNITENNKRNIDEFNKTKDFDVIDRARPARTRSVTPTGNRPSGAVRPAQPQNGVQDQTGQARNPSNSRSGNPGQTQVTRKVNPGSSAAQNPTVVNGKKMQPRVSPRDLHTKVINQNDVSAEAQKNKKEKPARRERGEGTNTVISIVKAIVYIMFVLVVSAFLAVGIIKVGNDVFAFVKSDEIIEVTIPEGAARDDVAKILADNNVISYPKIFSIYSKLRKDDGEYLAGTYSVSPMMNYDALIAEFKPKTVYGTCKITIPEGYTTDEIIDLFLEAGIGTREGYVDVIQNGDFDYWFVKELEDGGINPDRIYRLDGYLFPDTYEFYLNSSEWTVINKLLKRFSQIFTKEYRDQCDVLGYTVDEIVTLASIIEKEAASPSEFFLVSSVFHNRLNAPQSYPCFESDATVVYAIQHETGERTVDLNYDTQYNTYKHAGFTPGPISSPSASAMLAALSPQSSNYYFFVSHNNVTYFSSTKAEHDAYIRHFANENNQ